MIKKILVSQPQPSSAKSPYYNIAEKHGVELVFRPFIKVEGIDAKEFRKQKVNILDHTAIVFTSRTAVDHFFRLVTELRITVPEDMKYFGISETVALYIQKYVVYRKRKVFFGTTGKLPELIAVMAKHKSENYLIPLSDVHDDLIQKMLDEKNLKHSECVMYRTVSNDFTPDEKFDYDMLRPRYGQGGERRRASPGLGSANGENAFNAVGSRPLSFGKRKVNNSS